MPTVSWQGPTGDADWGRQMTIRLDRPLSNRFRSKMACDAAQIPRPPSILLLGRDFGACSRPATKGQVSAYTENQAIAFRTLEKSL